MPFNSFSEFAEDFWIVSNLKIPTHGFYVDIGCGDPQLNSNTAFLREAGWHGVGVDGNPNWVHRWNEAKAPFIAAVIAERTGAIGFAVNQENPGVSRIDVTGPGTRCRTIENLLCERFTIGKIDFLSIDVEGHEYEILKELDFEKHSPSVIVAEYATLMRDGTEHHDFRVQEMLEAKGYKTVHQTKANFIFTRE